MRNVIRHAWRTRWVSAATVLAVLLAACGGVADTDVPGSSSPAGSGSSSSGGKLTQDLSPSGGDELEQGLSFTLYQGSDVLGEGNLTAGSLRGKPLVINFWAGLCPPCRAEMPDLQEFYEENKERVNLLGIDVGQFTGLGDQASAKALLEELNVTYPAGFTSDGGVMRDYKILGMPTTVFIDSKGETFRQWSGVLNKDALTRVTNEMLEADASALNN